MPREYGFLFTKEKCIQCHGCVTACKIWRQVPFGIQLRRVENIWEGQYPAIKSSSASISCMHCIEPPCINACPEDAITKRDQDGIVIVDKDKCAGCRTCLEACPFGVPQFGEEETMQKCDMCVFDMNFERELPPCVSTCPTQAILFGIVDQEDKQLNENVLRESIAP